MKVTGYSSPAKGKFTIIAHSLGCYTSCNFALKHPHLVKEMIFLSPAGLNGVPSQFNAIKFIKSKPTILFQFLYCIFYFIWDLYVSPAAPGKLLGYYIGSSV